MYITNGKDIMSTVNMKWNGIFDTKDIVQNGSHNADIGHTNIFSLYGGLVAGYKNEISGAYTPVTGGRNNTTSGMASSATGGYGNEVSSCYTSVSVRSSNKVYGQYSLGSVGYNNKVEGSYITIIGGKDNTASDYYIMSGIPRWNSWCNQLWQRRH